MRYHTSKRVNNTHWDGTPAPFQIQTDLRSWTLSSEDLDIKYNWLKEDKKKRVAELKKIMKETCFGSLAFCCGKKRKCPSRDSVITKLGITKKDFFGLKKQFDSSLFKVVNSKELKRGK